jgi:hypothetical protein
MRKQLLLFLETKDAYLYFIPFQQKAIIRVFYIFYGRRIKFNYKLPFYYQFLPYDQDH